VKFGNNQETPLYHTVYVKVRCEVFDILNRLGVDRECDRRTDITTAKDALQ